MSALKLSTHMPGRPLQLQKELVPEEEEDPKKIKSEIEGQR